MFEQATQQQPEIEAGASSRCWVLEVAVVILGVYAVISFVLLYGLRNRVETLEAKLQASEQQQAKLSDSLAATQSHLAVTQSRLQASSQMLGQKLGLTQKQIAKRSAELMRQQQEAEARIVQAQQEEAKLGADVSGVKSDVGGVKTEVASTRKELEDTRARLERTIGDLGVQSGLIAKTRDDLEILKHRGDRNYYEFTLDKGKPPIPVSTVSLQLKKVDVKRSRYTLQVTADDKKIEKKDRGINEPVQFYTGRDKLLYELVVNTLDKNRVVGYLSTPKNAPQAVER